MTLAARSMAPTRTRAAALSATLGLAAACWVLAVRDMDGMDMGAATDLGSLTFFAGAWVPMMAAMMLPGAAPAAIRYARADGRIRAVALFAASYLAVWAAVGLGVYAVYRPHGAPAAGAVTIAAGVYELTPLKRACRLRCREDAGSGLRFGVDCVGSSIGLMAMFVALGAMSVTWMAVVAAIALAQKLLAPIAVVDVALALAIVALGVLAIAAPSAVPGLEPAM